MVLNFHRIDIFYIYMVFPSPFRSSLVMQHLLSRRVISLKGEGVHKLLQGLVTQDMDLLRKQDAVASLFLNSKGRIMTEAIIVKRDDQHLFLDLPAVHSEMIADHLTRHKLRLPIAIEKADSLGVTVQSDSTLVSYKDPRSPVLPERGIAEVQLRDSSEEPVEYRQNRFKAGIVEGHDIPPDSIPIFYNFDFTNSIAFSKGCYSGQELVTRTIRRGVVRKRLVAFESVNGAPFPTAGLVLLDGEKEIGSIFVSEGSVGMGVVSFESALNEKAQFCSSLASLVDSTFTVGTTSVRCLMPAYCS